MASKVSPVATRVTGRLPLQSRARAERYTVAAHVAPNEDYVAELNAL